jgi:hypothetical protein
MQPLDYTCLATQDKSLQLSLDTNSISFYFTQEKAPI